MADGWRETFPRLLPGPTRRRSGTNGHDQRGQNTFGTFLAAAHTLLGDDGMEACGLEIENLNEWGHRLAADTTPETANRQANWARCIEEI
jgi:hypothetical protein